jgi:hypothetical protein
VIPRRGILSPREDADLSMDEHAGFAAAAIPIRFDHFDSVRASRSTNFDN